MSACNILLQRRHKALHLMTDAATYNRYTGVLVDIAPKCHVAAQAKCALSSIGPLGMSEMIAGDIDEQFSSFDAVVDGIEARLPALFEEYADTIAHDCVGELYLAGWSDRLDRPAAYVTRFAKAQSDTFDHYSDRSNVDVAKFKLRECVLTCNPGIDDDLIAESGLSFARGADALDPEIDLLHLLELLRRRRAPSEKVVHVWPEDQLGAVINPQPIDWRAWRAEREAARARALIPEGLSPLKRKMLEKKLIKGKRRAA
jgi:hypothetical protein